MTALVTDEMLDEMAVAGTPADCRDGARRGGRRRADRVLLGAPVWQRPRPIRDYHDAILETFRGLVRG